MTQAMRYKPRARVAVMVAVGGCLIAGIAAIGGVTSAPATAEPLPSIAQHVAVPAYIDPTADPGAWTTLANPASGTGGIVVANILNGPDSQVDPAWTAALAAAHAHGEKVLGYVDSGYLGSAIASAPQGLPTRAGQFGLLAWEPQIQEDINAWYSMYGANIDGIFFDEGTNQCGPTAGSNTFATTYAQLSADVKRAHPGALTVINPGTAVPQCYQNSADVLVTFEGSYGDYTGNPVSPAEAYVPLSWNPVDPDKIWHLVYGVPDQATMEQVVAFSKTRGAGWIYVTNDVPANPYDTLPPDAYWADEQAQAAATGVAGLLPPEAPVIPAALHRHVPKDEASPTQTTLQWSAPVTVTTPLAAYDIYENGSFLTSVPAGTTSFTVTDLQPDTSYSFTVVTRDLAGMTSPASTPVVVTTGDPDPVLPTAPQLSVSATTYGTVDLAWTPSAGDAAVVSYDIYEGPTLIARLPSTLTSAAVGVPEPGLSTYTFSVRAEDATGNLSPPSNYLAATTLPVPENLPVGSPSVTVNADGSITYAADYALPFAFRRAFIATGDPSAACWATSNPTPICADFMIENGVLYSYAGTGIDFTWTTVAAATPVLSGTDTYSWTLPASEVGSPAGQTVLFNGQGYSPLSWAPLVDVGAAPGPIATTAPTTTVPTTTVPTTAPTTTAPATTVPATTVPVTTVPSTDPTVPDSTVPTTDPTEPDSTVPSTDPTVPDSTVPTTVPDPTVTDTTTPDTTLPPTDATVPDSTVPTTATVPDTTTPTTAPAVPDTTVPDTTVPDRTVPAVPDTTVPDTTVPTTAPAVPDPTVPTTAPAAPTVTAPVTGRGALCPASADGQWHLDRTGGCLVGDLTFDSPTLDGQAVGADLQVTDQLTLSPVDRTWQEWLTLKVNDPTDSLPSYSATLTPTCGGLCQVGGPVDVALTPNRATSLEIDGTDAASATTDWVNVAWSAQLVPQASTASPSLSAAGITTLQWSTADLRCDSVAAATPGCVFPESIPTFSVSSSTLGDVAADVVSAQQDGGWGLQGAGAPLAFTSNPQLVQANVDNGCWSSPWHLAQHDQACDQYPFSTTYQGSSQTPDAVAVPISLSEEEQATALLNAWYASQRLVDGDQFWVSVGS